MKLYYTLKTVFLALYLTTWVASVKLFLIPLINLYGGWTFLGYFIGIFCAAAITSFVFFAIPKPRKPQATPRHHYHPDVEALTKAIHDHKETNS